MALTGFAVHTWDLPALGADDFDKDAFVAVRGI
jgi:hypothetical protein